MDDDAVLAPAMDDGVVLLSLQGSLTRSILNSNSMGEATAGCGALKSNSMSEATAGCGVLKSNSMSEATAGWGVPFGSIL